MKKIICLILLLLNFPCLATNTITAYQPIFLPIFGPNNKLAIAIRIFELNNVTNFLIVDPNSLKTAIMPVKFMQPSSNNHPSLLFVDIINTRYYKLLNAVNSPPYLLENHGIKHATKNVLEQILTIDLCPTSKQFESVFFKKLVAIAKLKHKPMPITIAISGRWIKTHSQEFAWLRKQAKKRNLQITWANHTFGHVFYKDLDYSKNFLLSPGVNIKQEVLLTEQFLLEEGVIPSIFFRFPGLVSSKKLIHKLKELSLIPIGADAWLAKDQKITPGGIILVHGNSNEHEGIMLLMSKLDKLKLIDIKNAV